MKKVSLFYGSSSGNVEIVAEKIQNTFGADYIEMYDISKNPVARLKESDRIIFGSSTWGDGELQDNWNDWIIEVEKADLSNKKIALFGLGDQAKYSDTFADCLHLIHKTILSKGCEIIGDWDETNYKYNKSLSLYNGKWLGLVIDEDNQSDLTDERVQKWCDQIREKMLE